MDIEEEIEDAVFSGQETPSKGFAIAQAQLQSCEEQLASLTPEKVREEVIRLLTTQWCPADPAFCAIADKKNCEECCADQILSIISAYWEAKCEKCGWEYDPQGVFDFKAMGGE